MRCRRPPTAAPHTTTSIELAGENSPRIDDADLRHVERAGDAGDDGRDGEVRKELHIFRPVAR